MELLKALRLLSEPSRVRILRLLHREELSVAELQEILGIGQSGISMHLSQLRSAGFVEMRRSGQKSLYRVTPPAGAEVLLGEVVRESARELVEATHDDRALEIVIAGRKDALRGYFDELAGRFGRNYVPGRSWKALCEVLIRLLPPELVIADIGAGEATLSLLLAQRAKQVIAVDASVKMVEYGTSVASGSEVSNFDYRQGDFESLPIDGDTVDVALMHQVLHHAMHPRAALVEARRILKPGGRMVILDLLCHTVEAAREMYADQWLGFSRVEMLEMLEDAGFYSIGVSVVDRDPQPPHFESLMAIAEKPVDGLKGMTDSEH